MDIVDSKTRSKMMGQIRSKNTKPELLIRKGLFSRGFRYSLYSKKLPGKPDLSLPKYNAVILIHGCFWHMHDCPLFVLPKSRTEFWEKKLTGNKDRDNRVIQSLLDKKWRIAIVWECSIKGKKEAEISKVIDEIEYWLYNSKSTRLEIPNVKN